MYHFYPDYEDISYCREEVFHEASSVHHNCGYVPSDIPGEGSHENNFGDDAIKLGLKNYLQASLASMDISERQVANHVCVTQKQKAT